MDTSHTNGVILDWMFSRNLLPNVAVNIPRMGRASNEKEERLATRLEIRSQINRGKEFFLMMGPTALLVHFAWPGKLTKDGKPSGSVRVPDLTNLIGGFKHTLDGFQDAKLIVDDALIREVYATASMDWGGKGWMLVKMIPLLGT